MEDHIRYISLSKGEVYSMMWAETHSGAYASYIRGKRCRNEDCFFQEISASFQFPFYFGENWGAVDDCLRDLDWLSFTKIVIFVDDFSATFSEDSQNQLFMQKLLIKHFGIMVDYWKAEGVDITIWLNN